MSRRDPGAATGAIPTEPGRCRCRHLEPLHRILASRRHRLRRIQLPLHQLRAGGDLMPRPKVRPTQPLHNLGRGGNKDAHYITTCKLCPAGVFANQPYRWLRVPAGYSHDGCIEQAGLL